MTDDPRANARMAYQNRPMDSSAAHDLVIDAGLLVDGMPIRDVTPSGDGYDATVPVEMLKALYARGVEHGMANCGLAEAPPEP